MVNQPGITQLKPLQARAPLPAAERRPLPAGRSPLSSHPVVLRQALLAPADQRENGYSNKALSQSLLLDGEKDPPSIPFPFP